MNGYVTPIRYGRIINVPVALAQTELRRGKAIHIAQVTLELGQVLELRTITLNLIKVLTFGASPDYNNTSMGLCSVGLYFGSTITSPISYTKITTIGAAMINPFTKKTVRSPGLYTVLISNNTSNLDMSVAATGSLKLYL